MNKLILQILIYLVLCFFYSGCRKYELAPKKSNQSGSGNVTIDSLRKIHQSYYYSANPTLLFRFQNDARLTCTVIADEVSGNLYKTIFVQDSTGTIQLKLINSGGLYTGDRIQINLNGAILDDYQKMVQLDSIDTEQRIVKLSSGSKVNATKLTFNQILSFNNYGLANYQSRLIILDSVEFDLGSKNQLFSDPVFKSSVDRTLINPKGQKLTLRTSGYANFAGSSVPCGKGQLCAVVSQYSNTIQLTMRDIHELSFISGNCPYLAKNFEDQSVCSGAWTMYNVKGSIDWKIGNINGNYASISNFSGGNKNCETWLISPPVNLLSSNNPVFNFTSAYNYQGPALQVYVSTDYHTGDPLTASWALLNASLSAGPWAWTPSNNISLIGYKSENTRIAFKYTGSLSDGSTWEIDDIGITELQ